MPADPTIPELVARLRELRAKLLDQVDYAIQEPYDFDAAEFWRVLNAQAPKLAAKLADAAPVLELGEPSRQFGNLGVLVVSSPWRPIEDYLSLAPGEYMVRMKRGELEEHITIARWTGAEWRVRIADGERYDYYRVEDITHIHRMGPIRGPGRGDG